MSKKPRKKKKYDVIKTAETIAKLTLKKNYFCFACGCGAYVNLFDRKGLAKNITPEIATMIAKTRQKWSVTMYVMLRDNYSKDYIQSQTVNYKQACLHSEISDQLADMQMAFMEKETNPNHRLSAGWIASVEGIEPDDAIALDVFTTLGAFEFKAPWEPDDGSTN